MAAPNQQTSKDTVFHQIKIDGQQIGTNIKLVSMSVVRLINKVAHAQIVLTDGDAAKQNFQLSDQATFLPGNDIEVLLGYSNTNTLNTVFKGVVTRHTVHAPEKGQSRLVIEAKDKAVHLTLARQTLFFSNKTDKNVIDQLARNAGLQPSIADMPFQHPQMVMYDALPWDFIVMRAEANGKLVLTEDGVLKIVQPEIARQAHFKAKFGDNLFEVEAEMDARRQLKKTVAQSWDYTKQEVTKEQGRTNLAEPGNLSENDLAGKLHIEQTVFHNSHLEAQQLAAWANSHAQQSRLSKTFGRARMRGNASLRVGQTVELDGVGARFNGLSYITGIVHHFQKGWETEIQFGWGHEWFYRDAAPENTTARGLLPGVPGLQTGLVIDEGDNNDPDFKVKIKLPMVDPDGAGVWARVLTPVAGNGHGMYFRPKQGDEVLVSFIDNDPRYPIVLGSLYSRDKMPGIASNSTEQKFGYKSPENQQLLFDDTSKVIKLQTGNCSITIDGQSNTIELKAGASHKIKITETGIEINASGQTVVKGNPIMLN